jgi:hypothetical protein
MPWAWCFAFLNERRHLYLYLLVGPALGGIQRTESKFITNDADLQQLAAGVVENEFERESAVAEFFYMLGHIMKP